MERNSVHLMVSKNTASRRIVTLLHMTKLLSGCGQCYRQCSGAQRRSATQAENGDNRDLAEPHGTDIPRGSSSEVSPRPGRAAALLQEIVVDVSKAVHELQRYGQ